MEGPQRGGSLVLTQGHLLLCPVPSQESSQSVAPLSWLLDSKNIALLMGLSRSRRSRTFTEVAGCEITAEGLTSEGREERGVVQLCLPLFLHQLCMIASNLTFFIFRVC